MIKFLNINYKPFQMILIFIVSLLLFIQSYAHAGFFFIDTSREVYVPMAMNAGDILYKDIFNVYTPIGYQINALLFQIFGENLNVLYIAGFINSLIFAYGLFFLGNIFFKVRSKVSLALTLFVIVCCVYAISLDNYIFPYSYSVVYALSSLVWSLLFYLYYKKYNKQNFLILSFLLFGLSVFCKYDFALFGIVLLFALFDKKLNIKTRILSLISLFAFPLLSTAILFKQGCTFSDLVASFNLIISLAKSNSVSLCYEYLGLIPSSNSLKQVLPCFITMFSLIAVEFFILYKTLSSKIHCVYKALIIFALAFTIIKSFVPVLYISNSFYFNWVGLLLVINFILISFILLKKHINKNKNLNIDKNRFVQRKAKLVAIFRKEKLLFWLVLSTILISVKCLASVNFNSYGTYFFPLILLADMVFACYYIPKFLNVKVNDKYIAINRAIVILLTILIILNACSNNMRRQFVYNGEIKTEKGTIYIDKDKSDAVLGTLNYLKSNTTKEDTVLVLPEGAMINFLTDRKSNNKYYYLIPPNIEIFGEENIVNDLEANLPNYIVIQPMSYNNFDETYFCESFGTKICELIPKYYESPKTFGGDFWVAVYKKK